LGFGYKQHINFIKSWQKFQLYFTNSWQNPTNEKSKHGNVAHTFRVFFGNAQNLVCSLKNLLFNVLFIDSHVKNFIQK
jgi:hypothetical protein